MTLDSVPGDATALLLPTHPDALRAAGPDFLTRAFHAFGSLPADNHVVRIDAIEPCEAGNSGQKLFLTVAYARPDPALHTQLFVKLSRDLADAFRDRRRHELEAEVRLAELSRHPAFPVAVAQAYFADFHQESGSGLLITQRVAFGEGAIEPLRAKCMDHELPNALEHYQATVTALARLAAAQHRGALSPELETLFPFDAVAAAADLPIDAATLGAKIDAYGELIAQSPQLFPSALAAPDFIPRLRRDVATFVANEPAVRRFLHADPRMIALTHWNSNIDNAWFERDADGRLTCGLLDWGMVRQMNLGYGLWGGLSAAATEMLDVHLNDLLAVFADELRAQGGPEIDAETLALHFDVSLALLGLALMMDLPALIAARLPAARQASGPHDPLLRQDSVIHGFLTVSSNFLNLWATRRFGDALARVRSMTMSKA